MAEPILTQESKSCAAVVAVAGGRGASAFVAEFRDLRRFDGANLTSCQRVVDNGVLRSVRMKPMREPFAGNIA
jgi:hypothetical protein